MTAINIVQIGMGPLGQKMTTFLRQRRHSFNIVGAVDVDPAKAGRDLGEVANLGEKLGIPVRASLVEIGNINLPGVALLTTVSDMRRITPQIKQIVGHGLHVVSTCEELSYPWDTNPQLTREIDDAAKAKNVTVLGTGVNPGFLMDLLPVTLTAVCQRVQQVKVSRIQNAQFRRVPFQQKIGAGLTLEQFEAKRQTGTLRHVGLAESVGMIAHRMGWKLTKVADELSPVIAEREIRTDAMHIVAGMAAGVQQIGRGFVGDDEKITLVFRAAVGEPDSHDTVEIAGEPNVMSTIKGGVNGDIATCAITLNAVKQVLRANRGLMTMVDIPAVSYFEG